MRVTKSRPGKRGKGKGADEVSFWNVENSLDYPGLLALSLTLLKLPTTILKILRGIGMSGGLNGLN